MRDRKRETDREKKKREREKEMEIEGNQCGKILKRCVREKEKGKWASEVEIKDGRGREEFNVDRKCGKSGTKSIGLVDS